MGFFPLPHFNYLCALHLKGQLTKHPLMHTAIWPRATQSEDERVIECVIFPIHSVFEWLVKQLPERCPCNVHLVLSTQCRGHKSVPIGDPGGSRERAHKTTPDKSKLLRSFVVEIGHPNPNNLGGPGQRTYTGCEVQSPPPSLPSNSN